MKSNFDFILVCGAILLEASVYWNELYYFCLDDINLENFVQELVDALWKIHGDVKTNSNDDVSVQGIVLEGISYLLFNSALCQPFEKYINRWLISKQFMAFWSVSELNVALAVVNNFDIKQKMIWNICFIIYSQY